MYLSQREIIFCWVIVPTYTQFPVLSLLSITDTPNNCAESSQFLGMQGLVLEVRHVQSEKKTKKQENLLSRNIT